MCPFLEAPEGMSAETIELLDRTFSATWREVWVNGCNSASQEDQKATRVAIAKAMIDLAATGVRETDRLKRHALHAADQASPRVRLAGHRPD